MIRGFDVLHNFISPVTGRILATEGYVLVGNTSGIAVPAPDLIDLRLDLINLRVDFDVASSASYITGFSNSRLPNAQVLYSLPNGFIVNTAGVVSTSAIIPIESLPNLTEDNIWVGDATNRPVESSNFVKGPIFSLPDTVALWDGETGRLLKNSEFSIAELEALAEEATTAAEEATAAAEESTAASVESTAAAAESTAAAAESTAAAAESTAAAAESTAAAAEATAAAAESTAAAAESTAAAAVASGAAAVALLAKKGKRGSDGRTGATGASGPIGGTGLTGTPGAAGVSGRTTVVIDSNMTILGGRIQDLAPSPQADYDAVSAKWVWDLLNDNVEIKWE